MSVALLERSVVSPPSEISIDMRNMSTLANPAAARTATPDRKSLQRIAAEALHTKSVTIDRIHGTLFRNYKLQPSSHSAAATTTTTTEETFYILKCRPSSPAIRLLRHEEDRLRTEAYTLQTLLLHSSSSSSTKPSEMPSTRMIPRLIASSPHHHQHRTNPKTPLDPPPYIITGPFHGHLLSEISPRLPQTSSEKIQQRVGFFYRNLTTSFSHPSSSSTQQQPQTKPFGPLYSSSDSSDSLKSFTTWSQFYTTLLETLLLDAEDALINLPYAFIRETVRRNQNSLDQITKPKLVFLEGLIDERNILVRRRRRLESSGERERRRASGDEWEISGILDWSGVIWGDEWMSDGFYHHFSKGRSMGGFLEGFLGGKGKQQNQRRSGEEVVRQYLYVLFFPLFLSLSPYRSIDGIYILFGSTNQNNPSSSSSSSSPHSHHNRYILYHSLLAIIRQCYRPSSSSSPSSSSNNSNTTNNSEPQQTELAARRNLTNALTQLSKICNFEVR